MTTSDLAGHGIDVILAVGGIAVALIAAGTALIPVLLGALAGDEMAIRWHARQLGRQTEAYANHPANRRPRKEDRP